MVEKDPPTFGKESGLSPEKPREEKPREKSASSVGSTISERSVMQPSAARNDYYERVAAATGKGMMGDAGVKMTSDNYQEVYRQQQAALQRAAQQHVENATAEAELKKAADAKKMADVAAREKNISAQIDAWRKAMMNDHDAESRARTSATIEALARELAFLRKK